MAAIPARGIHFHRGRAVVIAWLVFLHIRGGHFADGHFSIRAVGGGYR